MAAASNIKPGPRNAITDVHGILVGHATDRALKTGVTVIECANSLNCAVDVRGGGPGTRETDALRPENFVHKAHAIVLTGGSVFGLASGDAVTQALSAQDIGLKLQEGSRALPIVPCAVLHDLSSGLHKNWGDAPPYFNLGKDAVAALGQEVAQGNHGAGIGAKAGYEDGGIGTASLALPNDLMVGAIMAVNPVGSVRVAGSDAFLAHPWEIGGEFGAIPPTGAQPAIEPFPNMSRLAPRGKLEAGGNTTIGVVAVNADLTASDCQRLAMMAQDGIARAVRPAHTPFDGDTIFAVAAGGVTIPDEQKAYMLAMIGSAMADCVARAIAKGVYHAAK